MEAAQQTEAAPPRKLSLMDLDESAISDNVRRRFWSYVTVAEPDACWVWRGATVRRYGKLYMGRRRVVLAHRISVALSGRHVLATDVVMHSCDNPPCVNPAHLSLGTKLANARDASAKNRLYGTARVTVSGARWMRWARAYSGASHGRIARAYGVNTSVVSKLLAGKTRAFAPSLENEVVR